MSLALGGLNLREQDIGEHYAAAIAGVPARRQGRAVPERRGCMVRRGAHCRNDRTGKGSRADWSETKNAFVVDDLLREYRVDKVGARKALFGRKAPIKAAQPARDMDELIALVGPRGPARR